jgi:hypothetical protein
MKETTYFQFPLCLLQSVLKDKEEGVNLIISYSIVNRAFKTNYAIKDVSRQLMYDYYRNPDSLKKSLKYGLNKYVKEGILTLDEDYNGFNGSSFDPKENMQELGAIYNQDNSFKQDAIFHYQLHCAAKLHNVKLGSAETTLSRYYTAKEHIESHEATFGADPMPGIVTRFIFDVRDKKNYDEIIALCALTAIRSVIGPYNYAATHKSVIAMRMIGAKNKKALEAILNNPANKQAIELYGKYMKRYPMDKMLEKLQTRKFLHSKISVGRRIYVSAKLNMQELEKAIIDERAKKNLKKCEQEARERIFKADKTQQLYKATA